jgi:HD superfamily phosphodiesterase
MKLSMAIEIPEKVQQYFEKDDRLSRLFTAITPDLIKSERWPHHCWDEHYRRVLRNAVTFAEEENLSFTDAVLVITATLVHDIGYHYPDEAGRHLQISHRWVHEHLGDYDFSPAEVEIVADAVLHHDHKLGEPSHEVGKILHDADTLEKASISARVFGAAIDANHPLRREIAHKNINSILDYARAYLRRMEPFRSGSYYYTETGRRYDAGRLEMVRKLFELYIEE